MIQRTGYVFQGIVVVVLFSTCTFQKTTYKGDLYFKLINIGSYYGADPADAAKFERGIDSLGRVDRSMLSKNNRETLDIYGGLKKAGLIDKPYFSLRVDSATIYTVYTSPEEYKKIEQYNHNELLKEKKKVVLELTGEVVKLTEDFGVIHCTKINKTNKVDGQTYWKK